MQDADQQKATGASAETPAVTTNSPSGSIGTEEVVKSFLAALDPRPEAVFNIEAYSPKDKATGAFIGDRVSEQWQRLSHTGVLELIPVLAQMNAKGAGIYIAVNEFNGKRKKDNLVRVRCVHADFDKTSAPEDLIAASVILPPTLVVQSSPNKFHAYWRLREGEFLSGEKVETLNRQLVKTLGADKASIDCAHLLRLPGFNHTKGLNQGLTPEVLLLEEGSGVAYSAIELISAFSPAANVVDPPATGIKKEPQLDLPISAEILEQIAQVVEKIEPEIWVGYDQLPDTVDKSRVDDKLCCTITRVARSRGVPEHLLPAAVEDVFMRSGVAKRDKVKNRPDYVSRTVAGAIAKAGTFERFDIAGVPLIQNGVPVLIDPRARGDVANAELYAAANRGKLLYVTEHKTWLLWDGNRWSSCNSGEEIDAAKKVGKLLVKEAGRLLSEGEDAQGRQLLARGTQAQQEARIKAMINLASSEAGMRIGAADLDNDPLLLGVRNGVVHLKSGALLSPNQEMLITKSCNAAFDPEAACSRWLQFLRDIFPNDPETIESVQRLLGYTLTGLNTEEKIIICIGYGSNGKSVFGNVVHTIMGDYSQQSAGSLLVARRLGDASPRDDIAALAGCRYVGINETQAGDTLDAQVVKMLAGREPITARNLYSGQFTFVPQFTPWLRTNHKPIVRDTDDGIWRRLIVLPFARKFTEAEQDPALESKLMKEQDGILGWMIEGAQKYLNQPQDRLKLSQTIKSNGLEYRTDSDLLGQFLDERTEPCTLGRVIQSLFFAEWRAWCAQNGIRPTAKRSFTRMLVERGYGEAKSGAIRFYCGLELLPSSELFEQLQLPLTAQ